MKVENYFKRNTAEIKALAKLKLKLTKEQEQKIIDLALNNRYISFIQKWRGKIIERTFATRRIKGKVEYQEVKRFIEGNSLIALRNIDKVYYSMGYSVLWKDNWQRKGYTKDFYNHWWYNNCDSFMLDAYETFNIDDIIALDDNLKYCAYNKTMCNVIFYITKYRQHPKLEMLSKLDFSRLDNNEEILKKLEDKHFCKWLFNQSAKMTQYERRCVAGRDVLLAYKRNIDILDLQRENVIRSRYREIFSIAKLNKDRTINYLLKNDIDVSSYIDLIRAVKFLKLDLADTKNIYPKDFKYWHDYYSNLYVDSLNAETDNKISAVAKKYECLLKPLPNLTLLMPTKTNDFIKEGNSLHHCVGRMSYNTKMANDETLIIFIRKSEKVEKPYVTMEYDPHSKKIKQLYADHDETPCQEVKDIIYGAWLPSVKKLRFKEVNT